MLRIRNVFFTLLATTTLAGCVTPTSGPSYRTVESQAALTVSPSKKSDSKRPDVDYALVDISTNVVRNIRTATTPSLNGSFGSSRGAGSAPSLPLGVGDVVRVAIFESQSGGLFVPVDAGSRPGNFVTLPDQTIGRNGSISVPYAGEVKVSGRSVEQVQKDIQARLQNRAIEPQVVITKVSSVSAQVSVLGDVKEPAKIELTEAGDRILDALSRAGGLSTPGQETYVTLQRRGKTATVLYDHLTNTPSENIYVAPGDTILVNRERRTYLAFGASGLNGRFDFEESNLTMGEALGKAGGLLDARANAGQVLLYRVVNKSFLRELGAEVSKYTAENIPVIFRANLRDPSTFFLLQQFPMQDKDIIFATNADSVEINKVLDLIGAATTNVVNGRESVKNL